MGGRDMSEAELFFFNDWPQLVGLYEALRGAVMEAWPGTDVKVSKTQISFRNRHIFAMASLPIRRFKGFPREYLLLSLGMPERLDSPRVAAQSEPYPGRWTCHVPVCSPEEIDGELMGWLERAWRFAETK